MNVARFDLAELYEAALDDDHFAALPDRLGQFLNARSAVIHWLDSRGQSSVDAHSNYFTPDQFDSYATNFAEHDLWTHAGSDPARRNQAWNAGELVSSRELENSIFYNEWIRALGDDTFHCVGAVMETRHGLGIIGLHRGRAQGDFAGEDVDQLNDTLDHLRRAITIRSALVSRNGQIGGWRQIFDRGAAPALIVGRDGRLRIANDAADALMSGGQRIVARGHLVTPAGPQQSDAFRALLARATDPVSPQACQGAFGSGVNGVWLAEFMPLVSGHLAGCAMITIIDRSAESRRADVLAALRQLHGLTVAEADVANALSEGLTLDEIGAARSTSVQTVRAQVKQIQAKTGTRRQSDIVRLVLRLALK